MGGGAAIHFAIGPGRTGGLRTTRSTHACSEFNVTLLLKLGAVGVARGLEVGEQIEDFFLGQHVQ